MWSRKQLRGHGMFLSSRLLEGNEIAALILLVSLKVLDKDADSFAGLRKYSSHRCLRNGLWERMKVLTAVRIWTEKRYCCDLWAVPLSPRNAQLDRICLRSSLSNNGFKRPSIPPSSTSLNLKRQSSESMLSNPFPKSVLIRSHLCWSAVPSSFNEMRKLRLNSSAAVKCL